MTDASEQAHERPSGDELSRLLGALANPHRMRIVRVLAAERVHVSQLAREVGLSRPLVHMHLRRLEAAGLVVGELELSPDGRAMKFFSVAPFSVHLTPELISHASESLTAPTGTNPTEDLKGAS